MHDNTKYLRLPQYLIDLSQSLYKPIYNQRASTIVQSYN